MKCITYELRLLFSKKCSTSLLKKTLVDPTLKMKHYKLWITLLMFCATFMAYLPVNAQTLPQNVSTLNVNDLTDAQIRELVQQARSAGLTDSQLIQEAQRRGMSATQAQNLQKRIADLRTKDTNATNSSATTTTTDQTSRSLNYQPDTVNTPNNNAASNQPPIFGANLFRNGSATFEPNLRLATPVNYVLGPGDQLNINVYGNSLVNWKLEVSPEGNINIPGVGILNVAGKTIEQATSAINSKLAANNYAIGRGTSVKVTLGDIRSIKVIMVGELVRPGTYTVPSLATAFNALSAAGGPNNNGSFRRIEIIRNNRVVRRLDVYDFLLKGDQKDNITLRDQDIIRVPTYTTRVELRGEVKSPALFEVLPGEFLQDVLRFAGGFTNTAYTARIKVSQISDDQRRITDVSENDFKNYIPLRGDVYTVDRILDRYTNRITINGAVFRPGEYELENGMTLLQLIQKTAGLKEDAFTGRGTITRLKPDNSTEMISFNVNDVINRTVTIPLQREDVVTISSIFDLRDQYRVNIIGEVRSPGEFAYADSMKVEDLILMAGGFAEGASPKRIEVSRRINTANPNSKESQVANVYRIDVDAQLRTGQANFTLRPFDIVSIFALPGYEKQRIITIEGEVLYPGPYVIQKKNEKISDLLVRAGGLTASADPDGGTLKRNNIAILGVDQNKVDTAAISRERIEKLAQVNRSVSNTDDSAIQVRNNYVGIDLKQILKKPGSSTDLLLEDGDILRIPKQQQIVRVNGQILYPSAVTYAKGKTFNDYVLNAGGYAPDALKRGAYVVYPNGTVRGTRKFLFFNSHPPVKAGSEIFVPKKPERRGISTTEIIGLTTGIASLGAIILGIINLSN
jgi:protein involved in polysaccharide export with SLBB domain